MTWLIRHESYPWWLGHGTEARYTLSRCAADAVPFASREEAAQVADSLLHYVPVDAEDTPDAVDSRGCA